MPRKKIAVVFGTRPEIIKMARLIRLLKGKKGVKTTLVYTGQHYDYSLYRVFMRELQLPSPDKNLGVQAASGVEQVAAMTKRLVKFFSKNRQDIVVAEGDTNSVLAAALASAYCNAKFAHVEAGLRSFDMRMPEEANRVIADNVSHYAFAPTRIAVQNLKKSACRKKGIALTGNTIVETVQENMERAAASGILERLGLEEEGYAVLTSHRQEYVDRKECLQELLRAVGRIRVRVVFPAHPRTVKNLKNFKLWKRAKAIANLQIVGPVGYFDFLKLASSSMFLLSDSGGIQEEASVYKRPVVVLRDSTERPEILGSFGVLTGYDAGKIVRESSRIIGNYPKVKKRLRKLKCPFGDGKASERIAAILVRGK